MNGASRIVLILFALSLSSGLAAATIFTKDNRYIGKIIRENQENVTLKRPSGSEITLPREEIVTIYDNDGVLLWAHPSIAKPDATLEPTAGNKVEIQQSEIKSPYRGLHLALTGGYGIGYGNTTFSTYPLGYGPDYRSVIEVTATGAWYFSPSSALTFGLGGSERTVPVRGIIAGNLGVQGNGYWPMQFFDVRAGYRFQSDIFFIELGLLGAINTKDVALTVETASSTTTGNLSGITQNSYLALSLATGVNIPISGQLFLLFFARLDHAVTPVINGNSATAVDASNNVTSSAPLSLVLLTVTGQIGIGWRLW